MIEPSAPGQGGGGSGGYKTFEVGDGFLRKVRVAPYQRGITRVVLEVDELAEYSAFLLPNPYRLVIDIHGKQQPAMMAKAEPPKPEPMITKS